MVGCGAHWWGAGCKDGAPYCRGHRCAAPCSPRRSVLRAQPRRRAGAPGAGSGHAGRPGGVRAGAHQLGWPALSCHPNPHGPGEPPVPGGSPASRSHPPHPAGPGCKAAVHSIGGRPPPSPCGTAGSAPGGPCSWGTPQDPGAPGKEGRTVRRLQAPSEGGAGPLPHPMSLCDLEAGPGGLWVSLDIFFLYK